MRCMHDWHVTHPHFCLMIFVVIKEITATNHYNHYTKTKEMKALLISFATLGRLYI